MAIKKYIIVLLIFICSCILLTYILNKPRSLGVINRNIREIESSSRVITFRAKGGENLVFKYSSSIKEGSLTFTLTDNDGTIVETFETGVSSSKKISLTKDDEYILSATCESFKGKYRIEVTR